MESILHGFTNEQKPLFGTLSKIFQNTKKGEGSSKMNRTHRAFTYTDKEFYLKKELNKIENSALKVGLNKSKVDRIFKDKLDVMSSNSSVPSNCDSVSNNESSNCNIVSNSDVSNKNCYVLMPFINSKLCCEVSTFFHNHNVKVSFRTGRNLYT